MLSIRRDANHHKGSGAEGPGSGYCGPCRVLCHVLSSARFYLIVTQGVEKRRRVIEAGGRLAGGRWSREPRLTSRQLDSLCPLLPLDPAFQNVVQVAGADDLLITGVEDGRVEEEWLSLRSAESAVVADELFKRRHLAGDGIDGADDQDVRYVGKLRLAPEMPRRVRAE